LGRCRRGGIRRDDGRRPVARRRVPLVRGVHGALMDQISESIRRHDVERPPPAEGLAPCLRSVTLAGMRTVDGPGHLITVDDHPARGGHAQPNIIAAVLLEVASEIAGAC